MSIAANQRTSPISGSTTVTANTYFGGKLSLTWWTVDIADRWKMCIAINPPPYLFNCIKMLDCQLMSTLTNTLGNNYLV